MNKIFKIFAGVLTALAVSGAAMAVNQSTVLDSAVKAPSFTQSQNEIKSMASPDVKSLIAETGKTSPTTAATIEKLQNTDMKVAQYTPRSTGCSTGCSVGCSVGCR